MRSDVSKDCGPSWFCPGVRVHKGITIVLSLFRSHWLAVVYCLVLCSGSCEPVHEDRTSLMVLKHVETRFQSCLSFQRTFTSFTYFVISFQKMVRFLHVSLCDFYKILRVLENRIGYSIHKPCIVQNAIVLPNMYSQRAVYQRAA